MLSNTPKYGSMSNSCRTSRVMRSSDFALFCAAAQNGIIKSRLANTVAALNLMAVPPPAVFQQIECGCDYSEKSWEEVGCQKPGNEWNGTSHSIWHIELLHLQVQKQVLGGTYRVDVGTVTQD